MLQQCAALACLRLESQCSSHVVFRMYANSMLAGVRRVCRQPCVCGVLLYENFVIAVEAGLGNTEFVVAVERGRFTVDGTVPMRETYRKFRIL